MSDTCLNRCQHKMPANSPLHPPSGRCLHTRRRHQASGWARSRCHSLTQPEPPRHSTCGGPWHGCRALSCRGPSLLKSPNPAHSVQGCATFQLLRKPHHARDVTLRTQLLTLLGHPANLRCSTRCLRPAHHWSRCQVPHRTDHLPPHRTSSLHGVRDKVPVSPERQPDITALAWACTRCF